MKYQDLSLLVGKRDLDDNKQIDIPGRLITPDTRSDVLLIVSTGLKGNYSDYFEHFGKHLGEEFNVYITEHRRKGLSKGTTLKKDFLQIDKQVRERAETNKVIYIGHSMGTAVANSSIKEFGQEVISLYGICSYPTYGDTKATTSELNEKSIAQKVIDLASKTEFGPLTPLTNSHVFTVPTKMAIGDNDHVLQTYKPEILQRFIKKFQQYGAEIEVFPKMNHCFNYKLKDWTPFNKDNPLTLVDNVKQFVYNSLK